MLRVFLLDVHAVEQHDVGDVGRCVGAEDRSPVAATEKTRQIAAVIDVRMREDDGIEMRRIVKEVLVLAPRLGSVPLKQAAIQKHLELSTLDHVLAASDFPRRTAKRDLHEDAFLRGCETVLS